MSEEPTTTSMAKALNLTPPLPFDADQSISSVGQRWKEWRERFDMYLVAANITDDKQKRAVLLYVAGPSVQKIFKTLSETGTDFKTAVDKLDEYFQPQKNVIFERYVFKNARPTSGESIDSYITVITRLRQLAETCNFNDTESEIRDQFVMTCKSQSFRTKLLREKDLTLAKLIAMGRAKELAEKQAAGMSSREDDQVNQITAPRERDIKTPEWPDERTTREKQCYNCGYKYSPGHLANCPAKGKTCRTCGKQDHFAKVCRSKKHKLYSKREENVKTAQHAESQAETSGSEDDEFTFSLKSQQSQRETVHQLLNKQDRTVTKLKVNGTPIQVTIDSGATTNILDSKAFDTLQSKSKPITLQPTKTKIYPYNSKEPLPLLGKCVVSIETKSTWTATTFYVVKGSSGSLLGYETATELGLLRLDVKRIDENKQMPPEEKESTQSAEPEVIKKYQHLFEGIGKLKDYKQKIHCDPTVTPVAQRPRRIPFHLRKQVAEKLQELEELDIIEPACGPSSWVSPIVAAPKPNNPKEVRVCGDYRLPNQALKRERHPIPTVDDLMEDMAGATMFSKVDLRAAYHQIELDENSRDLTTFCTHQGLYRYKRLPFGLSCASEVFQNAVQQALHGLTGVRNIADDIIVWGTSQEDHDRNLEALLHRLEVKGLTLNRCKCRFNQPSIWFYGYILSRDGLSADPKKVDAIKAFKRPTDVKQLRSFLGLANYCARFINDFSTTTAPLRDLTKKHQVWSWTSKHQQAFEKVKQDIAHDCTMAFYNPNYATQVTVDASPVGLGAMLSQAQPDGTFRNVAYASRSLSAVECRYSQTEKEALAVVWACERFHLYLIGTEFDLITDHKALEVIYSPRSKPPLRIKRWSLRLQQYKFNIKYRSGSSNAADILSRQPLATSSHPTSIADEYVNFIQNHSVPKSFTLAELEEATTNDEELQALTVALKSGNWTKKSPFLKPYYHLRNEFVLANNGMVLRDSRIVIPRNLRQRTLEIAHQSHQGIVKTKMLIRSKVWWPGIDSQVESLVRHCIPCQAATPPTSKKMEPLRMTKMPSTAWQTVYADFCGPFPTGEKMFVVIDGHSRYPEVAIMKTTTTEKVISQLQHIFARHGYPEELTTDNGPPFNAIEFEEYLKNHGVHHRKITPYWPIANAEAERFMKTVEKFIRATHVEGKQWQEELDQFLLNYRSTPHCTTGVSPASLLFKRPIRNKLPSFANLTPPTKDKADQDAMTRDQNQKQKMKQYADERNHAKEMKLQVGDTVLVKQRKETKLSTPYDSQPYSIVEIKGSMVTAVRKGNTITRNISWFKKIQGKLSLEDGASDGEESEDDISVDGQTDNVELNPCLERYPKRSNRRPPEFYQPGF